MVLDDSSYIGPADADSFKVIVAMQALEDLEKLGGIVHNEAGAIVAYKHRDLVRTVVAVYLDFGRSSFACVLQGIGKKVNQDLSQQCWIARYNRQISDAPGEGATLCFRFQYLSNVFDHPPEIDRRSLQVRPSQASEVPQLIHQPPHFS